MNAQRQLIQEINNIAEAMRKIIDIAETNNLGDGQWFCNGYPFANDLNDIYWDVLTWINNLNTTKEQK